ncbi:SiaB family protein kinase [Sanyastnella coralliicola]|uniref:SiaB family protein kinase n=1 Tax=Sanyastnella coralliicola TaxID=3069118 RepID=UPI0027BAC0FE|nr:SiaB family protein kinase [Longitalea sp. SCSIO 12813]
MAAISEKALSRLSELYHSHLSWNPAKEEGQKVLLSYFGEIVQNRIDYLLRLTEDVIIDNGGKRKVMKRVCSVLIECLQNTSIHGTKDDRSSSNSFFILQGNDKEFTIVNGNLILAEDANLLAFKLDELRGLTHTELRKLYIETLCNQNYSYKGGAGLGFLTIAKKSSKPIEYSILPLDEKFAFFTTEITVARV